MENLIETRAISCSKFNCSFYLEPSHCIWCQNVKIIKETWNDKEEQESNTEK